MAGLFSLGCRHQLFQQFGRISGFSSSHGQVRGCVLLIHIVCFVMTDDISVSDGRLFVENHQQDGDLCLSAVTVPPVEEHKTDRLVTVDKGRIRKNESELERDRGDEERMVIVNKVGAKSSCTLTGGTDSADNFPQHSVSPDSCVPGLAEAVELLPLVQVKGSQSAFPSSASVITTLNDGNNSFSTPSAHHHDNGKGGGRPGRRRPCSYHGVQANHMSVSTDL